MDVPARNHRRAIRRAAQGMRHAANRLAGRQGHLPKDEPAGYLDAFVAELRDLAKRLEDGAASLTVAGAKRMAMAGDHDKTAGGLARLRAGQAALTIMNKEATAEGLDPYAGMLEQ